MSQRKQARRPVGVSAILNRVWATTLLLPLLGMPAVAHPAAQPDIGQLGAGEVWVRVEPGKGSLVIAVGTSLPDISGIVVREAGSDRDLVRVLGEWVAEDVAAGLSSRTTEANITLDAATVAGNHRVRVPGSLQTSSLETTLIRSDGSVYTFEGKQAPTDGWFETRLVFSASDNCYTVKLECSGGCKTSKECCTLRLDYCADCVKCEITCPPCEILP